MINPIKFLWDRVARLFRGPDKQVVPPATVRAGIDAVADGVAAGVRAIAIDLQSGKINESEWAIRMRAALKAGHLAAATIAAGGKARVDAKILGYASSQIAIQYRYLFGFGREIGAGYPLDDRFLARAAMYGQAVRSTYESINRSLDIAAGYDEERRVLSGGEHCRGCVAEADRGWRPAGELLPIGKCECLSMCRCNFQRRRSGAATMSDAREKLWDDIAAFARGGGGMKVAAPRAKAGGPKGSAGSPKGGSGKSDDRWITIRGRAVHLVDGKLPANLNFKSGGSKGKSKPRPASSGESPKSSPKSPPGKIRPARSGEVSKRAELAHDLRASRRTIKDKDDRDTFNRHARMLRDHRRGKAGAIADDHAAVIRDRLRRHGDAEKAGRKSVGKAGHDADARTDRHPAELPPSRDPSTHTDHAPGHVGFLKTDLIHADPHRFQYKEGASESGSVGSLAGVKKYDHDLGGVVQVWKDHADGKTYVVNGHNRLDLAKKLGADRITVRYLDAKDHKDARSIGALTNIAEGRGTAVDAAKYFRDTGLTREQIADKGIPLREKVATDGIALSKLDKSVFDKVASGHITAERGAIIGAAGLEHHEQKALVALIDKQKGREITNSHLKELADEVKSARSVRQQTNDLFGSHEDDHSLALHKTKLQSVIKERLGKEKRLFGIVAKSKHAEDLSRAGNKIDTHESAKVSEAAHQTLGVFDTLKNRSGPVSRRLNDAAERIQRGENVKKVTDETYRSILKDLPAMLKGGREFDA